MPQILDLKKRRDVQPVIERQKPAPAARPAVRQMPSPPPVMPEPEIKPVIQAPPISEKLRARTTEDISWNVSLQESVRRKRMLWFLGICAIGGAIALKMTGSVLLLILIGLSAIITLANRTKRGYESQITVTKAGISVDSHMRYWRDMKSFWIEYNPGGIKELSIEPARFGLPYMKIPLGDTDPLDVRAALIAYLPENEHELSVVESFLKSG